MELSKAMSLIVDLDGKSIGDRLEWLLMVSEVLKTLDEKVKGSFMVINMNLRAKIREPDFKSKFESYPLMEDRIIL